MPVHNPPIGAPCWFELSSSDVEVSAGFHQKLFGWDHSQRDSSPMGPYIFLRKGDAVVAALCGLPPGSGAPGSTWAVYFNVADIEASIAEAQRLGGSLVFGPFDAEGMGRGAVLRDPTGAVFKLWQSTSAGGDLLMFENHSIGWVELATPDAEAARGFYQALLGWSYPPSKQAAPGAVDYREYEVQGTRYGGILPMTKEWGDMPAHWSLYVPVADIDTCLNDCSSAGGKICVPAFDAPGVGRIARIDDPTGAGLYVIQLDPSLQTG